MSLKICLKRLLFIAIEYLDATSKELENGKYEVDIEFEVSKYRNDEKGRRYYGEKVGDTFNL